MTWRYVENFSNNRTKTFQISLVFKNNLDLHANKLDVYLEKIAYILGSPVHMVIVHLYIPQERFTTAYIKMNLNIT